MTTDRARVRPPDFDPRQVPVSGVDRHLPAVAADWLVPDAVRARFEAPPFWQPEVLAERRFTDRPATAAAVLIPLVMRGATRDQPTVLLTERASHLHHHSGQIAFPGGKADPGDADATATALREAQEEVGLEAQWVHVVGQLPVYTTGSAFLVTPVVALVDPDHRLLPDPGEVADVFEVPLSFLMNPANHRRHVVSWAGQERAWFSMPFDDGVRQRFIWGATAGMLRNLYRLLIAGR